LPCPDLIRAAACSASWLRHVTDETDGRVKPGH
jgi:hypothetical protein